MRRVGVSFKVELCEFMKMFCSSGPREGVLVWCDRRVDYGGDGVGGGRGNNASWYCAACDRAYFPVGFQ